MGLQHSIEADARLVRLTYSGLVTFDEWAATMKSVFDDPTYQPGFAFLADRRMALTPTTLYVERAVTFIHDRRSRVAGSRLAIVVSNSGSFGMMSLAQMLAKHLVKDICVFKNLREAEHWLRSG